MTSATPQRPAFIPSLAYKDNRAALKWLQEAFGFEPSEILTDAEDHIVHAEMTHGDGVGEERSGRTGLAVLPRSAERTRSVSTCASSAESTSIVRALGGPARRS